MPQTAVVELKNLSFAFGEQTILDNFTLTVHKGEKISLVGESSSGKSTLFKVILGLFQAKKGEIKLFGQDVATLTKAQWQTLRWRIGMQFQAGALFDSLTLLENLNLAFEEKNGSKEKPNYLDLLAQVGLKEAALKKPYEISGGMRKRAALARALVAEPELLIFDEPTAGLDPVTSRRIIALIQNLAAQSGSTMILATTDIEVARHFSAEFAILNQGRLWVRDSLPSLLKSSDAYVKKILSRLLYKSI